MINRTATLRAALMTLLACLLTTLAWGQANTAPAGDGPKPAMIVDGHALTPAVWVEGLDGETVGLDGVEMMWVGAAAKESGGSAAIETGPDGKMLHIRAGIRTMEYVILPQGEFWRHPWVRRLIADSSPYQLQPMPYWPYEEANLPSTPPFGINWKRPYLDWKPDEAWLLLNLMPPPPEEPAEVEEPEEPEEAEEPAEPEEEPAEDIEADAGPSTAPPAGGMGGSPGGGMGGPPGGMGEAPGPPPGEMGAAPPPPGE